MTKPGTVIFLVENCPDFMVVTISRICLDFCGVTPGEMFSVSGNYFKMSVKCAESLEENLSCILELGQTAAYMKILVEGAVLPIIHAIKLQLYGARNECFFGAGAPVDYKTRAVGWTIKSSSKPQPKVPVTEDSESEDEPEASKGRKSDDEVSISARVGVCDDCGARMKYCCCHKKRVPAKKSSKFLSD